MSRPYRGLILCATDSVQVIKLDGKEISIQIRADSMETGESQSMSLTPTQANELMRCLLDAHTRGFYGADLTDMHRIRYDAKPVTRIQW